jgi:hypothetical protein
MTGKKRSRALTSCETVEIWVAIQNSTFPYPHVAGLSCTQSNFVTARSRFLPPGYWNGSQCFIGRSSRAVVFTYSMNHVLFIHAVLTAQHWRACEKIKASGLVVRVPGYSFRGPGLDSRHYQIFWVVVGLENGPLSVVSTTEELLDRKVAAPV